VEIERKLIDRGKLRLTSAKGTVNPSLNPITISLMIAGSMRVRSSCPLESRQQEPLRRRRRGNERDERVEPEGFELLTSSLLPDLPGVKLEERYRLTQVELHT